MDQGLGLGDKGQGLPPAHLLGAIGPGGIDQGGGTPGPDRGPGPPTIGDVINPGRGHNLGMTDVQDLPRKLQMFFLFLKEDRGRDPSLRVF